MDNILDAPASLRKKSLQKSLLGVKGSRSAPKESKSERVVRMDQHAANARDFTRSSVRQIPYYLTRDSK